MQFSIEQRLQYYAHCGCGLLLPFFFLFKGQLLVFVFWSLAVRLVCCVSLLGLSHVGKYFK